jgi:hypothetical protein
MDRWFDCIEVIYRGTLLIPVLHLLRAWIAHTRFFCFAIKFSRIDYSIVSVLNTAIH